MKNKVIAWGLAVTAGIVLALILLIHLNIISPTKDHLNIKLTTSTDDYGNFRGFRGFSNLDVFPEKLLKSAQNIDFYYNDDSSPIFDDSCQVYLKCSYNESDYQSEIQRLKSIKEQYQEMEQKTWVDNENFKFPAVVAIYNNNHCYEYALLNENNFSIIYVFLQFIYKEDVVFDNDFLPNKYFNPDEVIDTSKEGQSIYLFPISSGDKHGTYGKWLEVNK